MNTEARGVYNPRRTRKPDNFGFGQNGSNENSDRAEKTKLEKYMGSDFIEIESEPFPDRIGKWTDATVAGARASGFYQGLNDKQELVFQPGVRPQIRRQEGTGHIIYGYCWSEEPVRISYSHGMPHQINESTEDELKLLVEEGYSAINKPLSDLDNIGDSQGD